MLRTVGRILMIMLVTGLVGGVTFLLVKMTGGQAAGMGFQGIGGDRPTSLIMGLGQLATNTAELAAVVTIGYRLQRWWLSSRPTRTARRERPLSAA